MNEKLARVGRPARRVGMLVAVAGLVVVAADVGSGSAQNDSVDGRDPDAVPGPVIESEVDAPSPAVTDNGRGGADPASGPNPVPETNDDSATVDVGDIDTDSGELPVPDANAAPVADDTGPVDEDVPGSAASSPQPASDAVVDEPPVDLDTP